MELQQTRNPGPALPLKVRRGPKPVPRDEMRWRPAKPVMSALRQLCEYYSLSRPEVLRILVEEEYHRERLDNSRPFPRRFRKSPKAHGR